MITRKKIPKKTEVVKSNELPLKAFQKGKVENLLDEEREMLLVHLFQKIKLICREISKLLRVKRTTDKFRFEKSWAHGLSGKSIELIQVINSLLFFLKVPRFSISPSSEKRIAHQLSETEEFDPHFLPELITNLINFCSEPPSLSRVNSDSTIRKFWSANDVKILQRLCIDMIKEVNAVLRAAELPSLVITQEIQSSDQNFFASLLKKKKSFILNCIFESTQEVDEWKKIQDKVENYLQDNLLIDLRDLFSEKNKTILKSLVPEAQSLMEIISSCLSAEKDWERVEMKATKDSDRRVANREKIDILKIRLRAEREMIEGYREKILEFAQDISNRGAIENIQNSRFIVDLIHLISQYKAHEHADLFLIAISNSIKIDFIETALQAALEFKIKEILEEWRSVSGNQNIYLQKDLEKQHWERLAKSSPMHPMEEWKKSLLQGVIYFYNFHGDLLLAPPLISSEQENDQREILHKINAYITKVEELVSIWVFGDPSGTLLKNFRHIIDGLLKQKLVDSNENPFEFILETHERIFNCLGPIIHDVLNGESIDENSQNLINFVKIQLEKRNHETFLRYDVLTIATYLATFYRCLSQEFTSGTLCVLSKVYQEVYPDDMEGIKSIHEWSIQNVKKIEISLGGGIVFRWLKRRKLHNKYCLLVQDLTIQVPPPGQFHDRKGHVFQSFWYQILPELSEDFIQDREVKERLRRIACLLKVMEFPKEALRKHEE